MQHINEYLHFLGAVGRKSRYTGELLQYIAESEGQKLDWTFGHEQS